MIAFRAGRRDNAAGDSAGASSRRESVVIGQTEELVVPDCTDVFGKV